MVGPDVISVGSSPEAQSVLRRVEREATHRYQTLTLPEEGPSTCFMLNGVLVHRSRDEAPKSDAVSLYLQNQFFYSNTYGVPPLERTVQIVPERGHHTNLGFSIPLPVKTPIPQL